MRNCGPTKYPTSAVLPLAALTKLAYATPVETIAIPALFIFSDDDKVVRPELTREIAGRWGARHELVPVERSGDPFHHVHCRRRAVAGNDAGAGRPHRRLGEGGGGVKRQHRAPSACRHISPQAGRLVSAQLARYLDRCKRATRC